VGTAGILIVSATPWDKLVSRQFGLKWSDFEASAIDPYIVWADASRFSGYEAAFKRASEEPADTLPFRQVPILFERAQQTVSMPLRSAPCAIQRFIKVLARKPLIELTPRFGTRRLPLFMVKYLVHPWVQQYLYRRTELSAPTRTPRDFGAYVEVLNRSPIMATASVSNPTKYVVVIDDGCAFANAAFVDDRTTADPKSRIHRLWFQEDNRVHGTPPGIGFTSKDLNDFLQAGRTAGRIDEAASYKALEKALLTRPGAAQVARDWRRQMRASAAHGTHVLDVAAGNPNPLAHPRYGYGEPGDPASKAKIIFVQLPRAAVADTSGASMNAYVIEALAYLRGVVSISDQATINLSYGALAGPHDGTTLLEEGIDDFLNTYPRFQTLVLPAGNGYDSQTHARVSATHDGQWKAMSLQVLPDDPTDTYVEIWYAPGTPKRSGGGTAVIDVEVIAPDGASTGAVPVGEFRELPSPDPARLPRAALIHVRHPTAGGGKKHQALLALAPTRTATGQHAVALHGTWTIRVRNRGGLTIPIDAWIERDDSAFGSGRSRSQSTFLSQGTEPSPGMPHGASEPISRQACLNSFGHGERPVLVGGCSIRTTAQMASYSASGPGRKGAFVGPNEVAPCEDTPGSALFAAGTRSASQTLMNGTSVAAAAATRLHHNSATSGRPLPDPDPDVLLPQPNKHPKGIPYPDPALRRGRGLLKPHP
jgi:hypothetical protein